MRTNSPRRAANEDARTIARLFASPVFPTNRPSTLFFISVFLRMEFFDTCQPIGLQLASANVVFHITAVGVYEARNCTRDFTREEQRDWHRLLAAGYAQGRDFGGQPVQPVHRPPRRITD